MEQANEESVASVMGYGCQEEIHVCSEIGEDIRAVTRSPRILLSDELRTQE